MSSTVPKGRINSTLRNFLDNEASGGLVLMAVASVAILVANSPLAESYVHLLHVYIGPLSLQALGQRRVDGGVFPARRPGDQARNA